MFLLLTFYVESPSETLVLSFSWFPRSYIFAFLENINYVLHPYKYVNNDEKIAAGTGEN